jgi:hypothetical protein
MRVCGDLIGEFSCGHRQSQPAEIRGSAPAETGTFCQLAAAMIGDEADQSDPEARERVMQLETGPINVDSHSANVEHRSFQSPARRL